MPLHPQVKLLLDLIYRLDAPAFHTLSVGQARHATRKLMLSLSPRPPQVAFARDLVIASDEVPQGIAGRYYRPHGCADELLPLLVYFHGGGWTLGDIECYDVLCRQLCAGAGCAVLSVDYRLAPEHPFPAAPNDAVAALAWAARSASALQIDPARIAVGGDSAGGNLAVVAALWARSAGSPALKFQLLIYPAADQTSARASYERFGKGYGLDCDTIRYFQDKYLAMPADYSDWRASPLLAADLAGLPPALVITAEFDPLVDDCLALIERFEREGVPVRHSCYEGMIHGFIAWGQSFDAANDAVAEACAALRAAFEP